jgi:hypothetical protein
VHPSSSSSHLTHPQAAVPKGYLNVQKEGYLWKRPFTGSVNGAWQKRYFVLKDSFLFWFDTKSDSPFSTRPKGCLPLGAAQIFPLGKEGNAFLFEVTHMSFKHNMVLKSEEKQDVDDWIEAMTDCRKATYSNALLGNALLERMKAVGTAMEKEKEAALEELQVKAAELESTRDAKFKTMMQHMQIQQQHDSAVNHKLGEAQMLQTDIEAKQRAVEEQRLATLSEAELRKEAEARLAAAKAQVMQLAQAAKQRQKDLHLPDDPKIQRAFKTLDDFFALANAQ